MEDCTRCPSYMTAEEAVQAFGRHVGAPMCGRYGHVLGRPGLSEAGTKRVAEVFALKCDAFGQERPPKPLDTRTRVVNPDPDLIAKIGAPTFTPDEVSTCRGCANLVSAPAVQREIGYLTDLCKAKGKLVTRPAIECRSCPMAIRGEPTDSTDGMEIRAEYREGFVVPVELTVKKVVARGNTQDEPTSYTTDAPVSSEDQAGGIRAWRKVADAQGSGNVVFAPIFDRSFFTPEEQALIPNTGDEEHPELYVDYAGLLYSFIVESLVLEETVVLQAMPGMGKTEFARWVAWLMQVPFHRFSFTQASQVEDMIGAPAFKDAETTFILGRIPRAISRPAIICYDELNLAPDEIREFLRPTFDNSKQLVIDQAQPAIHVARSKWALPVVTQNPAWDIRNVGTKEMAMAEYDRLTPINLEVPPEAVERHILTSRCAVDEYVIPENVLTLVMQVSEDIREMSNQGTIPFTWGIRQTIKVARKTRWYSLPMAFKRAALDFYEPEVAQQVIRMINDRIE